MANNNGSTQVPPNSTGNQIDCSSLSVGGVTAYRQRVVIADNTHSANFALVSSGSLQVLVENTVTVGGGVSLQAGTSKIGFLQKISASVTVQGNVGLNAGTQHVGEVNISLMPAVVLAAGSANIGTINNISATVNVAGTLTIGGQTGNASATVGSVYTLIGGMDGSIGRVALTDAAGHFVVTGTVALAAGTQHIGEVNISLMPAVALAAGAANIGTINNISAAVGLAAGTQHIGEVNISLMPAIVLAAGAANIGFINGISATVNVAGSLTIGGIAGGTSSSAASSFTLIGGNDGSIARVALMDAAGHQIISGTVALAAGAANIGSINNISANVNVVLQTGTNNIGTIQAISAAVTLAAGANTVGAVTVAGFIDPSGNQRNVVDSANTALRVNVVAGGAGGGVVTGPLVPGASATSGNAPVLMGGTDGTFVRMLKTDSNGYLGVNVQSGTLTMSGKLDGISATVNVAGSLTIGGTVGATSYTAGSSFTIIGGTDGSFARGMLMDAAGHPIISGTVVLAAGAANIGSINNISAAVALAAGTQHIGEVNISIMPAVVVTSITNAINVSAMPQVSVLNVAGTANIGSINNISAAVTVVGNIVGGTTSATAGSSFVLIGGTDGSLARVALMDAAGHQIISGTVALAAGAANIGTINNISAGVVLAAGAANIGTINNISAAVTVVGNIVGGTTSATAGSSFVLIGGTDGSLARVLKTDANGNVIVNNISAAVVLAAGSANIGSINNISANVNVVLQTGTNNIGTIQAISAAVGLAAGTQHIGEVNISLMPTVNVNIAAQSAGLTLRIGSRVKTSASSTVADSNTNPLWGDKNGRLVVIANNPSLIPSASHGPKTVQLSGSATVALLQAQGAGIQNYVTALLVTNGSNTLTQLQMYEASATGTLVLAQWLAASGGGFTLYFDPPWRVSANTALNMRLKPSVSTNSVSVTAHFYVGVD